MVWCYDSWYGYTQYTKYIVYVLITVFIFHKKGVKTGALKRYFAHCYAGCDT